MSKIIDYRVIRSETTYILELEVQKAIREDWQPYGSLAAPAARHTDRSGIIRESCDVIQPMVKYAE